MRRFESMEDGLSVTVTRHAAERFRERTGRAISIEKASRLLGRAILDAVRWGELEAVAEGAWLAPVPLDEALAVFAVIAISGPAEKPFRVEVRTVLTDEMVDRSYGHLVGVGCRLAA